MLNRKQLTAFEFAPANHVTVKNADRWTNCFLFKLNILMLFRQFIDHLFRDLLKDANKNKTIKPQSTVKSTNNKASNKTLIKGHKTHAK